MKSQFKSCDRFNAKNIVIIGEDEVNENKVTVKNTLDKTQETLSLNEFIEKF